MVSPIKYVRARTKERKLTNFKTGDRFVDVVIPSEPLSKKVQICIWNASICHKEQKQIKNDIECGNCKGKGHIRRDCPNEPVCYDCLQSGHIKGSPLCPAAEQNQRTQMIQRIVRLKQLTLRLLVRIPPERR